MELNPHTNIGTYCKKCCNIICNCKTMNESKQPPVLIPVKDVKYILDTLNHHLNNSKPISDEHHSDHFNMTANSITLIEEALEYEPQPPADLEEAAEEFIKLKMGEHATCYTDKCTFYLRDLINEILIPFAIASGNKVNIDQVLPDQEWVKNESDPSNFVGDEDPRIFKRGLECMFLEIKSRLQSLPKRDNKEAGDKYTLDEVWEHARKSFIFSRNYPQTNELEFKDIFFYSINPFK